MSDATDATDTSAGARCFFFHFTYARAHIKYFQIILVVTGDRLTCLVSKSNITAVPMRRCIMTRYTNAYTHANLNQRAQYQFLRI